MPTIASVAERLTVLYGQLMEGQEVTEGTLDRLFDAVADLDALAGGMPSPAVRVMLDGPTDAPCLG